MIPFRDRSCFAKTEENKPATQLHVHTYDSADFGTQMDTKTMRILEKHTIGIHLE